MTLRSPIFFLIAVAVCCLPVCAQAFPAAVERGTQEQRSVYGSFGATDFIEYWSAYQLFTADRNPYDPELLLPIQQQLGRPDSAPWMMWNGPWTLTMLSPILQLPFDQSAKLWLGFSIFSLFASVLVVWSTSSRTPIQLIGGIGAACIFYPAWNCLETGQLSLLIALSLAITFWALVKERDIIAGISLLPLTMKPHLAYLLVLALTWWVLRERRYRLLVSFIIAFSGLIIATCIIAPHSLIYWFTKDKVVDDSPITVPTVLSWQSATLVGAIRGIIDDFTGHYPVFLIVLIPGVCALALVAGLIIKHPAINWNRWLPPLLCLSVFTAPYGWVLDQSVLLVVYLLLVFSSLEREVTFTNRSITLLAVATLFLGERYLALHVLHQHHYFFWVPLVLLAIWHFHALAKCNRKMGATTINQRLSS